MKKKKSSLSLSISAGGKGKKKGRPVGALDRQIRKRRELESKIEKVKRETKEAVDDSAEVKAIISHTKREKKKDIPHTKKEDTHQIIPVYKVFPDAASSTASPSLLVDGPTSRGDIPPEEGEIERSSPLSFQPGDERLVPKEVVVDKNGLPRMAGASMPEGEFIKRYRERAEQNLYIFTKGVLGRFFLTSHFHREICSFIQKCPPFRKLVLMPREHAKCLDSMLLTSTYIRDNVSSIDLKGKLKEDKMITESNGIKGVWRVETTSGRELYCTINHPFLRWENDWVSIEDGLSVDDWIGVVKKGSFGFRNAPIEASICGWMIANGCFTNSTLTAKDPIERDKFLKLLDNFYLKGTNCSAKSPYVYVRKGRQLYKAWGLDGAKAKEKFVPDFILKGNEETVRAFLYELIRHDGTKNVIRNTTGRVIEYSTISERLAHDVQHLLIKFGLHPKLRKIKGVRINGEKRPDYVYYRINFTDYEGIVYKGKQKPSKRCVTDVFPPQWRNRIPKGAALRRKGIRVDNKYASTRGKVRKVAEVVEDEWLIEMCDSDIKWEQITAIEYTGERETTSVETSNHTLTFGDIISHNTTIVAGGLPPHILIQPAKTNIYFPGLAGSECRILLCGETETMAKKNLRVIQDVFMGNKLFRAFWPERIWESTREAKIWSSEQIIIPRKTEWPDPTIRAIGVGGAVTGARPNVMIKDDLVSFKAANSETVMDEAIEWHKASRALLDKYEVESGLSSLEFIIGTRWAVFDLYSYIIDNDPSVEVNDGKFHKIVNNGKILWPEKNTMEDIEQLQREHGSNFYLLYLNSAADPELTDFDINLVRPFTFKNGYIIFEENEDDERLRKRVDMRKKRLNGEVPAANVARGTVMNQSVLERLINSGGGMRFRGV